MNAEYGRHLLKEKFQVGRLKDSNAAKFIGLNNQYSVNRFTKTTRIKEVYVLG